MRAYLSLASVIVSAAFTALGNGMMATFVPVRLNAEGVGPDGVGTVVAAYALGMLLGCVFSGRVVRRVGHIRAFTAFANDRAEPGSHVMLSGTVLVVWATGATLGPVVAMAAMRAFGPSGLWLYFIAVAGGFSLFVIRRQLQRERPSEAGQEQFVPRAASAAPIAEWSAPEGEIESDGEKTQM